MKARQGDQDAALKLKEKNLSKQVDDFAIGLARKAGMNQVPWFQVTQIVTGIYLTLSVLSCFYRPDFINVSSRA
jgi:hypothetical protein